MSSQNVTTKLKILQSILEKKYSGKPLYLVIGGYVNAIENKRGRSFFTNDNVFIIDKENCNDTCPFKDRYIQLNDIFNTGYLQPFKRVYESFDTILFDWSVYKFFFQLSDLMGFRDKNTEEVLKIYNKLLKPGGLLIIDDPQMAYALPPDRYVNEKKQQNPKMSMENIVKNYHQEIANKNLSWLTQRLQNSGFGEFKFIENPNELTDPIVKQVYTEGISEVLPVLVAEKGVSKGGKRKVHKGKTRKTRKNKLLQPK